MILFCVRCAMQPVITCLKHESECRDSLDVAAVYVTKVKCVRSYNDSRYSNHFIRTWLLWLVNSLRWSWRKNYVDTWCTFYRMTTCRCARTCRFHREKPAWEFLISITFFDEWLVLSYDYYICYCLLKIKYFQYNGWTLNLRLSALV